MAGLLPAFFALHLGKDVHPGLFPAREGSRESAEDAKSSRSADRSGFAESDGFGKMHKNNVDYKRGIGEFFETLLTNLTQHGTM